MSEKVIDRMLMITLGLVGTVIAGVMCMLVMVTVICLWLAT